MQVVYNEKELLHNPTKEMTRGEWKPYVESPERLVSIKRAIDGNPKFRVIESRDYSLAPILQVHSEDYIDFLQSIHAQWIAEGLPPDVCLGEAFATLSHFLPREVVKKTAQKSASGKLGFYTADLSVAFMKDTWIAAYTSAQVVLTAADEIVKTSRSVYALCRPPGHHASESLAAGYCYINNAAVATRFLQANGKKKILILDIDYHHGNGTQAIFYQDPSVYYVSLHGIGYPYFTGSSQETGQGLGLGFNLNLPLSPTTTDDALYLETLETTLARPDLLSFSPDTLLVSLGLDTWHQDPIAGFQGLQLPQTYRRIGQCIRAFAQQTPVLFIQEGGYTLDLLGLLTTHVLEGYLD
ncbi:hypothetical protein BY458DRAFT_552637 [Sporodiniella umbellata]|nr:hypothetical protein BY458DRAFT_552637 [Sporodiniella umbellata]